MARSLALAALTVVQCLVAWVIVSNAAGLHAASLPSLGYLTLAGLAGLVLGLLTDSLVSNRRHVWGGIVAVDRRLLPAGRMAALAPGLARFAPAAQRSHTVAMGVRGAAPAGDWRAGGCEKAEEVRRGIPGSGWSTSTSRVSANGTGGRCTGPGVDGARPGDAARISGDERCHAGCRPSLTLPALDKVIVRRAAHRGLLAGVSSKRARARLSRSRAAGWAR